MSNEKPKCPNCGLESVDENPATYECSECGVEGFDCCVPGTNSLCSDCEDKEDDEEAE